MKLVFEVDGEPKISIGGDLPNYWHPGIHMNETATQLGKAMTEAIQDALKGVDDEDTEDSDI